MRHIPLSGRLPAPTRDDLNEASRAVYDAITTGPRGAGGLPPSVADAEGRLQGPFNGMVHASPAVGEALQHLGAEIRYGAALSVAARKIAILTVAAHRGSEFEWYVHSAGAREVGITDDMLEAIARGDAGYFDALDGDSGAGGVPGIPEAVVVRRATRELVAERAMTQPTWEAACDLLGVRGAVDLVILVGYYDLMALMLSAFRVPLPDAAQAGDAPAGGIGAPGA